MGQSLTFRRSPAPVVVRHVAFQHRPFNLVVVPGVEFLTVGAGAKWNALVMNPFNMTVEKVEQRIGIVKVVEFGPINRIYFVLDIVSVEVYIIPVCVASHWRENVKVQRTKYEIVRRKSGKGDLTETQDFFTATG